MYEYDPCGLTALSPAGVRAVERVLRRARRGGLPLWYEPMRGGSECAIGVYLLDSATRRGQRRARGQLPGIVRRLERVLRSTGTARTRQVTVVGSRIDPPEWRGMWWGREALA
jgi:hypothetical protein